MWPRLPGPVYRRSRGETNRESFRALLRAGQVHAVLAFVAGEPAGWCSFGPRATFPRLATTRALQHAWRSDTWSIVCFFIPTRFRGIGVAKALAAAATKEAFRLGAREVEGYPVEPPAGGKPVPALAAWTGVPNVFAANGFRRIPRPRGARPIYVRKPR